MVRYMSYPEGKPGDDVVEDGDEEPVEKKREVAVAAPSNAVAPALEPLKDFAFLSAEVADAGNWKALAIKARGIEESLREQIRRRDMLIQTADARWGEQMSADRDRFNERIADLESKLAASRANEKKALDDLETLKSSLGVVQAAIDSVKPKKSKAKS